MAENNRKKDMLHPHTSDRTGREDNDEDENLGLDADHSSETKYHHLNNDNDLISGNPDGETDDKDNSGPTGESSLTDK